MPGHGHHETVRLYSAGVGVKMELGYFSGWKGRAYSCQRWQFGVDLDLSLQRD
jgi:hypothetical protein